MKPRGTFSGNLIIHWRNEDYITCFMISGETYAWKASWNKWICQISQWIPDSFTPGYVDVIKKMENACSEQFAEVSSEKWVIFVLTYL